MARQRSSRPNQAAAGRSRSAGITGRSRAEEARAASHERERAARAEALERAGQLEATLEAMTDAVLVFDKSGQIQHANRAWHTLFDLHPDYLGRPVQEGGALALLRDEQGQPLPREQWPSYRVLRGDVLTSPHAGDIAIRTPDGRDLQLSVTGAPVRDGDRQIIGGILVLRDVTERRRLERRTHEALQALLAMAEALVEAPHGPDSRAAAQAVANRLGVLTCEVLGCRSVGIVGMQEDGALQPLDCVGLTPAQVERWRERVVHWPYQSEVFRAMAARLRTGELVLFDTTLPEHRSMANPFGIDRYLLAPLRVGTTLVGLLSLNYGADLPIERPDDAALIQAIARLAALVIERERLQQEREEARSRVLALEEANRRMDTFLAIAGHEMRTPLTSISGQIGLAQQRAARLRAQIEEANAGVVQDLTSIQRSLHRTDAGLQRLNRLVGDLLDVSRIQAGHLAVRLAPADLAAIVRDVVQEHRELAATRTIDLSGTPEGPVLVNVDAERIAQVVSNYLSNALKYSPPDRPVTVGIAREGMVARVWVRDEGPGVPLAEQERIWDRFYRVAGITHEYGSSIGLGLGLHISRSIIEQHQGQVGLESQLGAGARFWFTLPLAHPT